MSAYEMEPYHVPQPGASPVPVLICLKRKRGFKHSLCGCVCSGRSPTVVMLQGYVESSGCLNAVTDSDLFACSFRVTA